MRREVWIALVGVALACAYADDARLQQKVSFQEPAQSVGQILKKLSQQTGLTLFPVPPLEREILIVDAQEVPLKALMDALADALDAEWFAQPNGAYRFTRTTKKAQARRQQDDAELKANLPDAIQSRTEELQTFAWTREQLEAELRAARQHLGDQLSDPENRSQEGTEQLFRQSRRLNPARRLALRLVQRLQPQRLLDIPVGERRVFSNLQGRYLEPFRFNLAPLLQQFAQEQSLLGAVWHDPQIGIDAREQQYREREDQFPSLLTQDWGDLPDRKPVDAANLRLFLEVQRGSPTGFVVSVYVEDLAAQRVYRGAETFSISLNSASLPDGAWREQPVEWSDATRLLASAASAYEAFQEAMMAQARGEAVSTAFPSMRLDAARQRVLDPALTEPHSLKTTDLLRSYARAQGKALVALPKETDLIEIRATGEAVLSKRSRLGMYAYILQGYRWRERDGILIATPPLVSYAWGDRFDRVGVSRVSARLLQQGYLTLDDRLEWAQAEARGFPCGEHWAALRGAVGLRFSDLYNEGARLLNRFSKQERNALLNGATIRLHEMSPAARHAILHAVYHTELGQLPVRRREAIDLPHATFPNGLPPETALRVQVSDSGWMSYIPKRGDLFELPQSLNALLVGRSDNDTGTLNQVEALFGVDVRYELQLVLPNEATALSLGVVEAFRPFHDKPARWSELPESVRTQISQRLQLQPPSEP
ncbi:MAG: hypothetical protein NZ556_03145 [Fimbriimonadales bacterium]|nr:hypothetical protein [Fimbriimonadales bacterium]